MYSKLSLLFLLLIATLTTQAQDVIHLMDGTEQKAIVKTVAARTVTYKRADNPDGPDYTLSSNTIDHITYAKGTETTYAQLHYNGMPKPHRTPRQLHAEHKLNEKPLLEVAQVKVAPSSLFDPWGMMLPISVEYNFGKHYGVELMGAIPFDRLPASGLQLSDGPTITGIKRDSKYALNLLRYVHTRRKCHLYVGVEAMLRNQVLKIENGDIYSYDGRKNMYFQRAELIKSYFGLAAKFGITARIAGNFWFDTYLGIGGISGHSWHNHMSGLSVYYPTDDQRTYFPNLSSTNDVEDSGAALYIPFAIRLSYHFYADKK